MKSSLIPLLLVFLLVGSASAQVDVLGGGTDCSGLQTAADLDSSFDTGAICTITDGASSSDCSAGGGSTKVTCRHNGSGTWVSIGSGGGGGSSIVLDIGDDGGNDSTGVTEVATNADANSIITEPSADKVLIDMGKDWPKADTSDDLTCTNCIGPTEITDITLGTDTAGNYAGSSTEGGAATTALALDADPASCVTSTHFAVGINTAGVPDCEAIADADVPDTITIDNAGAVEGTDTGTLTDTKICTYDLAGTEIDCAYTDDDTPDSDSEVPNGITTDLGASGVVTGGTVSTCARFDGSGNLVSATGDCPTGASTITYDSTNDGANESSAITHLECSGSGLACTEPSADQAQIALDSTVSLLSQTIESAEITNSTIAAADIANGDHGDFTYTTNVASLDADVVGTANIADADHGVFTYASGVASLDTDAVDVQTHIKDADCSNGQVIKKSGGAWDCAEDADSATALGQPNTMYVCWDGTDADTDDPPCQFNAQCRTIQYAINRVTEQGNPSDWTVSLCSGDFDDDNEAFPIRFWNTDTSSVQYGKQAQGISIVGTATTISCLSATQTENCNSAGAFDATGSTSANIRGVSINGEYGPSLKSDGGMTLITINDVSFIGSATTRVRSRGINNTNYFADATVYSLAAANDYGSGVWWEVGSSTTGFCSYQGFSRGACASNTDCGGTCDSSASGTAVEGDFCAVNADCGAGTCNMTGWCRTTSADVMWINPFMQYGGSGFSEFAPRVCEGGATTLTGTVTTDHDDTCSANVCATLTGSQACTTNTDCRRYVVGSGTAFTTEVGEGQRVVVGGVEKTVTRVRSNTSLQVSSAWAGSSSAVAATVSNDGWPCDTNADCDTSGTCTAGSGTTFEEHIDNGILLSGGSGGYCGDASGYVAWPPTRCDIDDHFCQRNVACDEDADCTAVSAFLACNKVAGKCQTADLCDADGDCAAAAGCAGACTCPDECGSDDCLNYGVYAEDGNTLRLRDTTLTSTNMVGAVDIPYDYPENQVYAANGGTVQLQGGSAEVTPPSACTGSGTPYSWCTGSGAGEEPISTVLKVAGSSTVSADGILTASYLNTTKALKITPQSADPTTPVEGLCWWDDTANNEQCYDGTATRNVVYDTATQTLTNKALSTGTTIPIQNTTVGDGTAANQLITFNGAGTDPWIGYSTVLGALKMRSPRITSGANLPGLLAYSDDETTAYWSIQSAGAATDLVIADEVDGRSTIIEDDDGTDMMVCDELDGSSVANHCNFPVGLSESSGGAAYKVKAIQNECAVIEKLSNADDDVPLWMPNAAVTVRSVSCRCDERSGSTTGCDTTLATVTLEDNSGNAMTITGTNPTCTTGTATYAAVTAANTLTAGEGLRLNVTNTPTDDGLGTYTFCWTYTYD